MSTPSLRKTAVGLVREALACPEAAYKFFKSGLVRVMAEHPELGEDFEDPNEFDQFT